MTNVQIDFPGRERLLYRDPFVVLQTRELSDVRSTLREANQLARAGNTVIGFVAYEAAPAFDRAMIVRPADTTLAWFAAFQSSGHASDDFRLAPRIDWEFIERSEHIERSIATIREAISAGQTYQVNLTTRLHAPYIGAVRPLYEALRAAQGDGYHALIETEEFAVVSASPELFFEMQNGVIRTRPMKGTRPRGRWVEEDEALALELSDSEKDRAENLMIVDLLRNDLGRIARYGTVHPVSLFDVENYRTVHQLTSTIEAVIDVDTSVVDVFDALFPCGSVTGAPKISTMQLIADLETTPRGVYCGAVGVMDAECATFNVPIRTVFIDKLRGDAVYGTGAGITFDSDAKLEVREMIAKARVLTESWPRFELLETLRVTNGRAIRLEQHLDRMRESARYFQFEFDAERVHAALSAVPTTGVWRVRMLCNEKGEVRVQHEAIREVANATFAIARNAVDSHDRFLFHKTTHRQTYEDAIRSHPDVWDVVLCNERDEITEFTRGNIVLELSGKCYTPPLEAGILPGIFRAHLLGSGQLLERSLKLDDLMSATRVWLINSLREWVPVTLSEASAAAYSTACENTT